MIFNVQQGVRLSGDLFEINYKRNFEVNRKNTNR